MALESFTGTFAAPTSVNATFAVTGLGFEPALIIFFPTNRTTNGIDGASDTSIGVGAMTATGQWYNGFGNTDAAATSSIDYSRHTGRCIIVNDGSGTSLLEAAFVSMDTDGFTLDYSKVSGSAVKVSFMAFGGTNCDFEVGTTTITSAGGTGTVATTTAFQPKGYLLSAVAQTTSLTVLAANLTAQFSFGGGTAATEEFAVALYDEHAVNRTDTGRVMSTTSVLQMLDAGTSVDVSAEHSSLNATDFTINVTNAVTSDTAFMWIAFGGSGLDCFAGNFTHAITVATQAVTVETDFSPQSIIFASTDQLISDVAANHAILNLGLTTGVSSTDDIQNLTSAHHDNRADAEPFTNLDNTDILSEVDTQTGIATAAYNVDSLDTNGFTLGWTSQAAALNISTYFALKSIAGGAGPVVPVIYEHHQLAGGLQ
tara:strand:+ start:1039 stop:2319 length:1281 start_codon:yes stop_codon:yes gene_type:complete